MTAAATEARAERAARATALSPRAVTRGEENAQVAAVDWLHATFPKPAMSMAGLAALLGRMLGRSLTVVGGGGLLGFRESLKLFAHHGAESTAIGFLAFGGETQGGRVLLQLTGTGCGFVRDWHELACLLEDLGAKITRLDLAVDFLNGEHTVDAAKERFHAGGFAFPGKTAPQGQFIDDLGSGRGRTLYVGRAVNGKLLRVYEKGRQLGDPESDWVRYEVQFGNRDRVIPFEALIRRDAYFAGAYPALAELLEEGGEAIATHQAEGIVTLAHLWHHAKRCYGKVFHALTEYLQVDPAELVEQVRIIGLPRRLDPSSAAAGVEWADVLAQAKRKERHS